MKTMLKVHWRLKGLYAVALGNPFRFRAIMHRLQTQPNPYTPNTCGNFEYQQLQYVTANSNWFSTWLKLLLQDPQFLGAFVVSFLIAFRNRSR